VFSGAVTPATSGAWDATASFGGGGLFRPGTNLLGVVIEVEAGATTVGFDLNLLYAADKPLADAPQVRGGGGEGPAACAARTRREVKGARKRWHLTRPSAILPTPPHFNALTPMQACPSTTPVKAYSLFSNKEVAPNKGFGRSSANQKGPGASWRWLDGGAEDKPVTSGDAKSWAGADADLSKWGTGPAPLGRGSGNVAWATTLSASTAGAGATSYAYFRTTLCLTDAVLAQVRLRACAWAGSDAGPARGCWQGLAGGCAALGLLPRSPL
jgi:hypothetical protein